MRATGQGDTEPWSAATGHERLVLAKVPCVRALKVAHWNRYPRCRIEPEPHLSPNRMLIVVLALGATTGAIGAGSDPTARRSCESWQADGERSGQVPHDATAQILGLGPVAVYAAPAPSCACAGATLHPSTVVRIDRKFNGYMRILYLNGDSGEQVSGWVRSSQLHPLAAARRPGS